MSRGLLVDSKSILIISEETADGELKIYDERFLHLFMVEII